MKWEIEDAGKRAEAGQVIYLEPGDSVRLTNDEPGRVRLTIHTEPGDQAHARSPSRGSWPTLSDFPGRPA